MNAYTPIPQLNARGERCLADFAPASQPTVSDSIVRTMQRMPVLQQIAIMRSVMLGRDWAEMAHNDYDRVEAALDTFADDMRFALHSEDLRGHGHEVVA